jgi:hypothetical protein
MKDVGSELIEIEFAQSERILTSVRAREGEQILDDVREALRFVAKDGEGFAVFGGRAIGFGEGYFGFATQDGHRCAQLVRGIRNEAALEFEGLLEALEQLIEGDGQLTEFIPSVRDCKTVVKIFRAHAAGLRGHGGNGSQAFSRQKISSDAG